MKRLRAMGLIAALVGLVLAVAAPCVHAGEMLDLNRATLAEIEALPISGEMAETIWRYREYRTYYGSIYDLVDLPGMTMEDFLQIKPLVRIERVLEEDEELQRINDIYYRFRQWESEEGGGEALVDYWIDLAKDPFNVNTASYEQVANLQSVSPPDAVAIYSYTRKNRIDRFGQPFASSVDDGRRFGTSRVCPTGATTTRATSFATTIRPRPRSSVEAISSAPSILPRSSIPRICSRRIATSPRAVRTPGGIVSSSTTRVRSISTRSGLAGVRTSVPVRWRTRDSETTN